MLRNSKHYIIIHDLFFFNGVHESQAISRQPYPRLFAIASALFQ
jgi:hypothetical protein